MSTKQFYWDKIFPWDTMHRFLCQGDDEDLKRREIGIKKPSVNMVRNVHYSSLEELKRAVVGTKGLEKEVAERIEFGPMYPGTDRKDSRLEDMPLFVELRFDVDVKDYACSDFRYGEGCLKCSHFAYAPACSECWENRLEPSRKVLEYLLREVLGVEHVLWVFSGKKGYHGIVLDRGISGTYYPDSVREQLIDRIINPDDEKLLDHIFDKILWPIFKDQYLHEGPQRWNLPTAVFFDGVDRGGKSFFNGAEMFEYIEKEVFGGDAVKMKQHHRKVMRGLYWPRLDIAISSKVQHLLKLPFSIHDGTKKISTPILDPEKFRPEDALMLEDVCKDPSLLKPYVQHFEQLLEKAYGTDDDDSEDDIEATEYRESRRKRIKVIEK